MTLAAGSLTPDDSKSREEPDKLGRPGQGSSIILGVVLAFALLTNIFYFLAIRDFYQPDSQDYVGTAANLAAGKGFANSSGQPDTARTPGYPLLIVPFLWAGLDLKYLILLQHMLAACISVAVAAFVLRLNGNRRQAVIAGLLLAIDLPTLDAANSILSETLFTSVLVACLGILWLKKELRYVMVSGFTAGAAALVRPVAIYLFLPILLYLFLTVKTRRFRASISFLMAFAIIPVAWSVRNYHETGYFGLSTFSGYNMLVNWGAGTLAIDDPGNFDENLAIRQKQLEAQACSELAAKTGADCTQLTLAQKSGVYGKVGMRVLLQRPVSYLKLAIRSAAFVIFGGGAERLAKISSISVGLARKILLLYTAPSFCLAVLGLLYFWKENRRFSYLAGLVIVYFVVISAGALANSRYRVPIVPLYAIMIAGGTELIRGVALRFHGRV
jgi:4-amino-4-deoxy-L-arabinose transferase-like glycosyltransferase